MIIPGNEKLFKKWAEMNGYEKNPAQADYVAELILNEEGHITNATRAIDIIKKLQQEVAKLEASNNVCVTNSLQAAANTLMNQMGLVTDDNIIKTILGIPHENVKRV